MPGMPKAQETQFEIDLNALEANYHYLRNKLDAGVKFLAVVKAFSYGHDARVIAAKLAKLGVDYFAVAYLQEGISLREEGIKTPILVLHPSPVNFEALMEYQLEPSLYSPRVLNLFLEKAVGLGRQGYPVHLKFNTGLNRLGFGENDVPLILKSLNGQDALKVVSVFSHLAATEDPDENEFTRKQISAFEEVSQKLISGIAETPMRHLLNTSGILNFGEAQYDMVRSGIGLYGYGNDAIADAALSPVGTLKTVISQLHQIAPGESVGYNRGYVAGSARVTATLPIGHADGIGRHYGRGRGFVYINGHKAPIVGNVCMDMIMVDVSGIACSEGDEVLVFGKNAPAEALAAAAGTISYELLTGISQRIKRIVLG